MILHTMIVDSIETIIEQDLLVGYNQDELVTLRSIMHYAVLIFCYQQIKYVCNAPVDKPVGSEPRESCLRTDDPCLYIAVDTYEPPTCVADVLHYFLVYNDIHGGLDI